MSEFVPGGFRELDNALMQRTLAGINTLPPREARRIEQNEDRLLGACYRQRPETSQPTPIQQPEVVETNHRSVFVREVASLSEHLQLARAYQKILQQQGASDGQLYEAVQAISEAQQQLIDAIPQLERDLMNVVIEHLWDRKLENEITSLLYNAGMKGRTLYEATFRSVPEAGEPVSRAQVEQVINERLWLLAQERFTRFGVREQFEILLPTYQLNEYSFGQLAKAQDRAGVTFHPDGLYLQRDVLIEQLRRLTGEIAPNQGYVGVARLTNLVTAHPSRRFVRPEPNA